MFFVFHKFLLLALVSVAATGSVCAQAREQNRVLRVAADPNNLPFSNERLEGFENKLAALIARELNATIEYMWWPQRRGFFRETLGSGRADVVLGVPAGFERATCTRPYYRSTYVFIARQNENPVRSFDDPRLRRVKIGVQIAGDDGVNPPPAHALARRGLIDNVRGYSLLGDYGKPNPPSQIVRAVSDGDIDIAVAWGPMASYFAQQDPALRITPVSDDLAIFPMRFGIAVGVRRGTGTLRDEIDAVLERCRSEVDAILADYKVPTIPESDRAPGARSETASHGRDR